MKAKILLLPDRKEWAFERICLQIKKYLSYFYQIDIEYIAELYKTLGKPDKERQLYWELFDNYDLIINMHWINAHAAISTYKHRNKIIAGVFDHYSLTDSFKKSDQLAAFTQKLHEIGGMFCGCESIVNIAKTKCNESRIHLCEDGVDIKFFTPVKRLSKNVIGWAGNPDFAGNVVGGQPIDVKGYRSLILPASKKNKSIKLLIADRNQKWRNHREMYDEFYKFISGYICASHTEGTPNPALESWACGLPVISTKVGLVPKILNENTGLYIKRSVNDIVDKFNIFIKKEWNSLIIRKSIIEWDWCYKVVQYKKMFDKMLPALNYETVDIFVIVEPGDEKENETCIKSIQSHTYVNYNLHTIFKNSYNIGETLQEALDKCTTKYCAFIASHIKVKPFWLSTLIHSLETSRCSVATPLFLDKEHKVKASYFYKIKERVAINKYYPMPEYMFVNMINSDCLLLEKNIFLDIHLPESTPSKLAFDAALSNELSKRSRLLSVGGSEVVFNKTRIYDDKNVITNNIRIEQTNKSKKNPLLSKKISRKLSKNYPVAKTLLAPTQKINHLAISLSNVCNISGCKNNMPFCLKCSKHFAFKNKAMSVQTAQKILPYLSKYEKIYLYGIGDVLTNINFSTITNLFLSVNKNIKLITNGLAISSFFNFLVSHKQIELFIYIDPWINSLNNIILKRISSLVKKRSGINLILYVNELNDKHVCSVISLFKHASGIYLVDNYSGKSLNNKIALKKKIKSELINPFSNVKMWPFDKYELKCNTLFVDCDGNVSDCILHYNNCKKRKRDIFPTNQCIINKESCSKNCIFTIIK